MEPKFSKCGMAVWTDGQKNGWNELSASVRTSCKYKNPTQTTVNQKAETAPGKAGSSCSNNGLSFFFSVFPSFFIPSFLITNKKKSTNTLNITIIFYLSCWCNVITNKNKNNNTLYLWGSFLPGLLLTHPFYLFCVLGGQKGPRAWEVSSTDTSLPRRLLRSASLGLTFTHSFTQLFVFINQQGFIHEY